MQKTLEVLQYDGILNYNLYTKVPPLMIFIQRWFTPPIFQDEEKNFRARLLHITTTSIIIFVLLVVFGNLLDSQTPIRNYVIDFVGIAIFVYLRHNIYRGNLDFVGLGVLFTGFVGTLAVVISTGTVQSLAMSLFPLWSILATALFERKGLFISIIISSISAAGLIWAESAGMLPQLASAAALTDWFMFTVMMGMIGGLTYLIYQATRNALVRAEQEIVERKNVEEKLRQQQDQLSFLHQITLDLLNRRNVDELLQAVVDRAVALLDAPFGELMLEKNGELIVQTFTKNQGFLKGDKFGREQAGLSWQAFDTKQPVVLEDYATYPHRREIYTEQSIHAIADFPVLAGDTCIGVLAMGRSQPEYAFSETQIQNGVSFAQIVALVLDSAQLLSDAQREIAERARMEDALFNQNQRLAVLHQTSIELLKNRDVDSLLNRIVTQAAELVGASYGNIYLSEGNDLVLSATMSHLTQQLGVKEKKPGAGVLGQVWKSMKPFVLENYDQWEGRDPNYSTWNLRAFAGIPIIGHDGPLGVLEVARMEEDIEKFTPQEVDVFVQFASLASLVLDNAQLYKQAQTERQKADDLLLNILPREIAGRLKEDSSQLVADSFEQASILFADVVNFTQISAILSPEELVKLLNEIFSHFDELVQKHGLEKIKTIGDCYMAVSGVPRPASNHAHALTCLALEFQSYVKSREFNGRQIELRIGINSGAVVAGVIGSKKFAYDLWGDAVNVASRMEAHGAAGEIQITKATYDLIKNDFICQPQGIVNIKGKGDMNVWHVLSANKK